MLQQLLAKLPAALSQNQLADWIQQQWDWSAECPDPVQRAAWLEDVQRQLLHKLQTLDMTRSLHRCPQCGSSYSVAQNESTAVLCPQCGFQSNALFSGPVTAAAPALSPTQLPERFELRALLGEGSYGLVYHVWDHKLRRDVAIKLPKVERLNRDIFLREARAASRLSHPNIVRIYDVGEIGELTYIVSDLISGTTLGRWAATAQPSIQVACQVMLKIAQAMEYAHRADVIHRDLKPGNILIDERLEPVVLDFGLSHSRSAQFESIAKPGSPVGTPAFMSPEQVEGRLDRIDTWTDVYGLGVILYQLVTQTLPFTGGSTTIYEEIVHRPVLPPRRHNPKIAAALEAIILKALEKSPERRYTTAHELAEDLRLYLAGERVSALPRLDARVAATYSRRYFMPAFAGLSVVGLAGVWTWWRRERQANNPRILVQIDSEPADAQLTWQRLNPDTADWDVAASVTSAAGQPLSLPPGFYRLIARSGQHTSEVYRTVPADGQPPITDYLGIGPLPQLSWTEDSDQLQLPTVRVRPVADVTSGMVFVAGGRLQFPENPGLPSIIRGQFRDIGDFLIDPHEVTWAELLAAFPNYPVPARVKDRDMPADSVSWDLAAAYAEAVGKNLPSLWELLYVATNRGTTRFPWGNDVPADLSNETWDTQLEPLDQTPTEPAIHDLLAGVAEWTTTRQEPIRLPGTDRIFMAADLRSFQIFGRDPLDTQPADNLRIGNQLLFSQTDGTQRPKLGFRCLRRLGE